MNEPLAALRVKVPEAIVGVAIGELNRIGSWLDESSSDANGLVSIRVRVPVGAVPRFKIWLETASQGLGEVAMVEDKVSR